MGVSGPSLLIESTDVMIACIPSFRVLMHTQCATLALARELCAEMGGSSLARDYARAYVAQIDS